MKKSYKIFLAIVMIIIIIILALCIPFINSEMHLSAALRAASEKGFTTTESEFVKKYCPSVPISQNAAPIIEKAFLSYNGFDNNYYDLIIVGTAQSPELDQQINPELLKKAKKFVSTNAKYFAQIDKISSYNYADFDLMNKIPNISNNFYKPLNRFRSIARSYGVIAELHLNNKNLRGAEKSLLNSFHASKLVIQSSTTLSQLVCYACEFISLRQLERCINNLDFSDSFLKKLDSVMRNHEKIIEENWPAVINCELMHLPLAKKELVKELTIRFNRIPEEVYIDGLSGFDTGILLALYDYYNGNINNNIANEIELLPKILELKTNNLQKIKHKMDELSDKSRKELTISYLSVIPNFMSLIVRKNEVMAWLRCARTACAVERFRKKYGKLPEKLNQLVPEFMSQIPTDPFNGKKLGYHNKSFKVEYKIPEMPKNKKIDKSENNIESGSIFGKAYDQYQEIKYKSVIKEKQGYYIFSVGKDFKEEKSPIINQYKPPKLRDIRFVVITPENSNSK